MTRCRKAIASSDWDMSHRKASLTARPTAATRRAMHFLFLLPNGGVAVCNNSRYGTLAGDPFGKAIHHDNQLLRTNTVDDDLDPVWTSGKCSGYFSAADISEGGPALTAVTSVPTTSKLSGAYAELASFVETSGATKISDPSSEASFTTATALSEIEAASLLFLHPCAAVLALLLTACLEPLLRGQVKKKRVQGRSHAARSPYPCFPARVLSELAL